MKRYLPCFILLFWVASSFLTGCSKPKAKDIVVSELKTACAHVEAMEIVADEMIAILGTDESTDIQDPAKLVLLMPLAAKIDELNASVKQFRRKEAEQCPRWEALQEKSKKMGG
jgi:outer membrane murein-binding lipoprotein Lpp